MLSLSAGKLYYSEYIVSYGYNVIGNDERDMHSEKMSVMAKKHMIGHMGNLRDRFIRTKPPISNGLSYS